MRTHLESYLISEGYICKTKPDTITYLHLKTERIVQYIDGELIYPLPRISCNGKLITHHATILDALRRFDHESVVDAMFNKKITLVI